MIQLLEQTGGKLIATKATESLTTADFDKLMPIIEGKTDEYVKLKWYFEMDNVEEWNPKGFWEEVKFKYGEANSFEKIALVGGKEWKEWMLGLMKPFMPDEIEFFDLSQKGEAMKWLVG